MNFRDIVDSLKPSARKYEKKINLSDQLEGFYGQHRSGWLYALKYLEKLNNPHAIFLDAFVERTFCWKPGGVKPTLEPWIGFIHVPPNVPPWFQHQQSNDYIFSTEIWQKSFPYCRGLFTLSNYHKKSLETKLDIPINNLIHPTETPWKKWSWRKFKHNKEKKIIQVGWWLRKLHTIYQLPTTKYKKIFLKITHADLKSLMNKEREILMNEGQFDENMYETAKKIQFLPNAQYDRLLSENLIIINLYDSSANNTVIECIARNTPILVNPIEPIVEYLGEDYPLYFSSLEEAARKAEDLDLIYQTHRYLIDHPIKEKLTGNYFFNSFVQSGIYKSL